MSEAKIPKGYKQTEVGVIPEEWSTASFRDICSTISDGIHTTPKYSDNNPTYFINGNNIKNGEIVIYTDTPSISFEELRKFPQYISDRSIFMSINGSIGNLGLYRNEKVLLGKSVAYFNIKNIHELHYFFQTLQANYVIIQFFEGLTGSTISNLGLETIRNTQFIVPPLPEQRAIAEALSDVDNLLSSLDKLIEKKRSIKQGAMQELLTGRKRLPGFSGKWERKRLGEIAQIVMGQSPSSKNYNTKEIGIPLIQGNADIEHRKTLIRFYTSETTKNGKKDDVIMTVRAPVGEIAKATFNACLGRGVCSLHSSNNSFLYQFMIYMEASWLKLSKGSTFDSVNSCEVASFDIFIPIEDDEQTAIAAILSDMDADIEALEKRRDKTKAIKQGMMQELLTGRIRLV